MSAESWVTAIDVAQHLGVVKRAIYRWRECKVLHAHKIGQLWKFQLSEVDESMCTGDADNDMEKGRANKNESTEGKYRVNLAGHHLDQKSLQAVTGNTVDWNEIAKHCIAFANAAVLCWSGIWYRAPSVPKPHATRSLHGVMSGARIRQKFAKKAEFTRGK